MRPDFDLASPEQFLFGTRQPDLCRQVLFLFRLNQVLLHSASVLLKLRLEVPRVLDLGGLGCHIVMLDRNH
jgi:hypothetical protein